MQVSILSETNVRIHLAPTVGSLWFWNDGPRDGMALAPRHLCLLNK